MNSLAHIHSNIHTWTFKHPDKRDIYTHTLTHNTHMYTHRIVCTHTPTLTHTHIDFSAPRPGKRDIYTHTLAHTHSHVHA